MNELDLFKNVVPFVAVVEEGSFRAAAARLGVSPAAVSKAVATLESSLRTTLLERNARSIQLTPDGKAYFEHCQHAVAALKGARADVDASRKVPEGELVLSAPFIAARLVTAGLALLRTRHPRLTFRVLVTDRLTRLAEEPVDIAVRVGPLAGASLVARKLRSTRTVTVAAPSYLARHPAPRRVADLAEHACLVWLSPRGTPQSWLFASGPFEAPAAALVDHAPTLLDAALAGIGIAQLLDFTAHDDLREGRLVALFADESAPGPDVHAVCAPGRRASPRTRAAFDAFAEAFAGAAARER